MLGPPRTFVLARPTQRTSGPWHMPSPQLEVPFPWTFSWLARSSLKTMGEAGRLPPPDLVSRAVLVRSGCEGLGDMQHTA